MLFGDSFFSRFSKLLTLQTVNYPIVCLFLSKAPLFITERISATKTQRAVIVNWSIHGKHWAELLRHDRGSQLGSENQLLPSMANVGRLPSHKTREQSSNSPLGFLSSLMHIHYTSQHPLYIVVIIRFWIAHLFYIMVNAWNAVQDIFPNSSWIF